MTFVVFQGDVDVKAYFPRGIWYDYHLNRKVSSLGAFYTLHTPADQINIFFRGGSIIPTQKPGVTTTQSRRNKFKLIVAYNATGRAIGRLYLDSDDIITPIETGEYSDVLFASSQRGWLFSTIDHLNYKSDLMIGEVVFLDMGHIIPKSVKVNGNVASFVYDDVTKVMTLSGLNLPVLHQFKITWQYNEAAT